MTCRPDGPVPGGRAGRHRVALVDDHPITRRGVRAVLERTGDYEVCGEAGTLTDALAVIGAEAPEIVVTGLSLPDSPGRCPVPVFAQHCPTARVLVFSVQDERFFAARALHNGARGYLMKGAEQGELVRAVRTVTRGERYVSRRMESDLLAARGGRLAYTGDELLDPFVHPLTTRQQQILCLLKIGFGTTDVAQSLGLSIKTVETHCSHLKDRFGLKSARELLCFAAIAGPCPDQAR